MSRPVIMKAPAFFAGDWLKVTHKPTVPLPDDVADRLVERGRAVEVEDAQAASVVEGVNPGKRKARNRGADAVLNAPAPDPAASHAELPEIEAESDPDGD